MRSTSRLGAVTPIAILAIMAAACGQQATAPTTDTSPASSVAASQPAGSEATLTASSEPAAEPPDDAVVIEVGPGPHFTLDEVTVPAGTATFFLDTTTMEDDAALAHNFVIGSELREPIVMSDFLHHGDTVAFTVSGLTAGTYTFWCSVDEHYAYGMVGTLEVEEG